MLAWHKEERALLLVSPHFRTPRMSVLDTLFCATIKLKAYRHLPSPILNASTSIESVCNQTHQTGYVKAYIKLQENESGKLEVFNLEGRLVQFHSFSSAMNGEVRAIQLQPLTRGVYLTRLSIGNAIETKKLIVE